MGVSFMSAKYPSISHTVIIGTIGTTVPLMPLVTQIYREGGLGTLGMNASQKGQRTNQKESTSNARNTGSGFPYFHLFDARLIQHNALDITSSPSLGENAVKNSNLSPFLSPFTFKQAWANSFMED
jgi:hypothetical protein